MVNSKWEMIDENKRAEVAKYIDIDSFLERLTLITGKNKNYINKVIDKDELRLVIGSILTHNDIDTKEDVDKYINNVNSSFISPYKLTNADIAAATIKDYINNPNSRIIIKADYDADGIMAGYIANSILTKISVGEVITLFPERKEGYGISINDCSNIIKNKGDKDVLVLTVDNGITKNEEVKMLKENMIEVIITDHHKSDEEQGVPNCIIVNPHNEFEDQSINTKHLCGTQVIFKVLQILLNETDTDYGASIVEYVPYVAIACLADVMPVTAENNAFVQYGLEMINRNMAGDFFKHIKESLDCKVLTTEQVLWNIAPMINACGRLDKTYVAVNALMNPSIETVNQLTVVNGERQDITKAFKEKVKSMECNDSIVVHIADEEECPRGTIGILAAKIAERFNRPAIALLEHDGICHGSIRSANGINMYAIAKEMYEAKLFKSYAGHEGACVCEFDIKNLEIIRNRLNSLDLTKYTTTVLELKEKITLDITLNHLTEVVYAAISLISLDNKTLKLPNFIIKDLNVDMTTSKTNPLNVKLNMNDGTKCKSLWAWGLAEKAREVIDSNNGIISIVGSIKKNFMGNGYVLDIKDIL